MDAQQGVVVAVLAVVVLAVLVIGLRLLKAFNGPDGERWVRQRMQGPFAPLGDDDPPPRSAAAPARPAQVRR